MTTINTVSEKRVYRENVYIENKAFDFQEVELGSSLNRVLQVDSIA